MSTTMKLLVPIGLAVAAAVCNLLAMNATLQPVQYVQVTRNLNLGEVFDTSALAPIDLPAKCRDLEKTAIPYKHVGVILNQPAQRNFLEGDIVFWRDSPERGLQVDLQDDEEVYMVPLGDIDVVSSLLRIGQQISFRFQSRESEQGAEWVGPFRIVTVGGRLSDETPLDSEFGGPGYDMGGASVVGVAVPKGEAFQQSPQCVQLERFCDRQALEQSKLLRIKYHVKTEDRKRS